MPVQKPETENRHEVKVCEAWVFLSHVLILGTTAKKSTFPKTGAGGGGYSETDSYTCSEASQSQPSGLCESGGISFCTFHSIG